MLEAPPPTQTEALINKAMAPSALTTSSSSKKATSKAARQRPSSSSSAKRSRTEGTSSSPVVIDSDDDAITSTISAPSSKRIKSYRVAKALSSCHESDTSDDEPLMRRIALRTKYIGSVTQLANNFKSSSPLGAIASGNSARFNLGYTDPLDAKIQEGDEAELSKTLSAKGSVYGKKTNLTTAFQSASGGAKPLPSSHLSATNSSGQRKVPRSGLAFTKMRLQNTSNLGLSFGKSETGGDTHRSSSISRNVSGGSNKSDTSFEELQVIQSIEVPEDYGMADADHPGGFDIHEDDDGDKSDEESDGTLVADSEDEYAASPTAARQSRIGKENLAPPTLRTGRILATFLHESTQSAGVRVHEAEQEPNVPRAMPPTPATEVIDLTGDEPVLTDTTAPASTSNDQGSSLADRLFPKSPTPPPPSERPETTAAREAAFLGGFRIQWWAGGLSFRAATSHVNAALHPRIPPFSDKEGKSRLLALCTKDKLAIRHGLVYHPDCDPGPDTPQQTPTIPRQGAYVSPAEKVLQECRKAEALLYRSPHGKISEGRFRIFDLKLHSAVKMEKTLFQDELELVDRCVTVLNEWMHENAVFSENEVRAAFASLAKQGKVRFEGDVVALLSLD
ncbi:hypothetical protein EKO04_008086 [Ascochyta lentis]|uniref:MCM3-like winged helix domain-containing protein n=1 Tax=Ascochyta lentis TaxID=205686 RepID=A0A8H7IYR8_9PLEO|nr:hypothetical protein EKO04_008086 [Ascochyta lentis]